MTKTMHVTHIVEIEIADDKVNVLVDRYNQCVHSDLGTIDNVAQHIALCASAGLNGFPGLGQNGLDEFRVINKGIAVNEVL